MKPSSVLVVGFDWDPRKAATTWRKRRIDLGEAATVTSDPLTLVDEDQEHSADEERYRFIGLSDRGWVLVVTVVFRGDSIRVISARRATKRERHAYTHR